MERDRIKTKRGQARERDSQREKSPRVNAEGPRGGKGEERLGLVSSSVTAGSHTCTYFT